jgi:internalin A
MGNDKVLKGIRQALAYGEQHLDLNGTDMRELPREIAWLTELRSLELNSNKLVDVPQELGELTKLNSLDLKRNRLTNLSPAVYALKNLTGLGLADNSLTGVSREIGNLTALRGLWLSNNQLQALPAEIGKLTSLEHLWLQGNRLTQLPPEIGQLAQLISLDVRDNHLTSIPPELGQLPNLEHLLLEGNPITSPPPEIVQQGSKAVLTYLRSSLEDSRRQWISKLLLVGQGGVGKTCLLRGLRDEEFRSDEVTTHGIAIQNIKLRHPQMPKVVMQLNSWDFGGQEIYHATHQFFLTNRALFLLVWSARQGYEQGKLYYWLDMLHARAPESPILLVATWTDERDADIPLAELKKKYSNLIGQVEVSNKTGKGIEQLQNEIASAAAKLPLMGESWPGDWLRAAELLRDRPENFVVPRRMWEMMKESRVTADGQPVLARWLHELGHILYFQDIPELRDLVILRPQWVTDAISKVLDSDQVIDNLGVFTRKHMEELWADLDLGIREHFLRLMEQFDLSYRTLGDAELSIVVERLRLEPPPYEDRWKAAQAEGGGEITLRYVFRTSVPAGLPTWFIARSHRFTTRTHWRHGALFADGSGGRHLGLIRAYPNERYIELSVRGPAPHNFFTLLRDGLELTLRRFPGLQIERRIPCPGHEGAPCEHEFRLQDLERAIERQPPITEIQCPVTFEPVSILGLLFGLHPITRDAVLRRLDELETAAEDRHRDLVSELKDLRSLAQREFTNIFQRDQASVDSQCPNIFVLRDDDSTGFLQSAGTSLGRWRDSIVGKKLELQLLCQAPGAWHETIDGGRYTLTRPAEWLVVLSPYLKMLVAVLKHVTPLVGPWLGAAAPGQYVDRLKVGIELTAQLVKQIPEFEVPAEGPALQALADLPDDIRATGATLRVLRKLLNELDPSCAWGNLRLVLTPEGHYLWLCPHHAGQYSLSSAESKAN